MSRMWQVLVALALFAPTLAACSSGSSSDATGNPTVRDSYECLYTYCDAIEQDCKTSSDNCWSTCATMEEYAAECAATCSELDCGNCSQSDRACEKYGHVFTIVGPPDPNLLKACQDAVQRDIACGEAVVDPNCDRAARIEKPSNVDAYECVAQKPCGSDMSDCAPPASNGGEDLCTRMTANCGTSCDQSLIDWWNAAFVWYKPTTLAAGYACLDIEDCSDRMDCVNSWATTVGGT